MGRGEVVQVSTDHRLLPSSRLSTGRIEADLCLRLTPFQGHLHVLSTDPSPSHPRRLLRSLHLCPQPPPTSSPTEPLQPRRQPSLFLCPIRSPDPCSDAHLSYRCHARALVHFAGAFARGWRRRGSRVPRRFEEVQERRRDCEEGVDVGSGLGEQVVG
jgi:hypothetical protein